MFASLASSAVCRAMRPSASSTLAKNMGLSVRTVYTPPGALRGLFGELKKEELTREPKVYDAPRPQSHYTSNPRDRTVTDMWGQLVQTNKKVVPISSLEETWALRHRAAIDANERDPPAGPYSGRSFDVRGNFADAYKRLSRRLAFNNVKKGLRAVQRYEKPGYKRRRLSSERWRKKFSAEVRGKVRLVNSIQHRQRTGRRA